MAAKCWHCGADEALHRAAGNNCPLGGMEASPGKDQRWADTKYLDADKERIRQAAPALLAALKALLPHVPDGANDSADAARNVARKAIAAVERP